MLQTSPIPSNSEALNMITMEFDSDSYIHETWHTSKEKSLIQLIYLSFLQGSNLHIHIIPKHKFIQ